MVSKNRYEVWSPSLGQSVDDADEVIAWYPCDAVQRWAQKMDEEEDVFEGGIALRVCVVPPEGVCMRKSYTVQRQVFYPVVED